MIKVFYPARKTADVQAKDFHYCTTLIHHLTTQQDTTGLCWATN